jgi:hypothetical protein
MVAKQPFASLNDRDDDSPSTKAETMVSLEKAGSVAIVLDAAITLGNYKWLQVISET